jgi:hypothetical protein
MMQPRRTGRDLGILIVCAVGLTIALAWTSNRTIDALIRVGGVLLLVYLYRRGKPPSRPQMD